MALPAPCPGTARGARATPTRRGGKGVDAVGARAHTNPKGTRGEPAGQPDRARGTHRPHGMVYRRARIRVTRTARPATHSAENAGTGRAQLGGRRNQHRPQPPRPAASAAHTRPGRCTRQGSSGTPCHAPTSRLGSLRASPRGSQWRKASSMGPAAPAPRSTTH